MRFPISKPPLPLSVSFSHKTVFINPNSATDTKFWPKFQFATTSSMSSTNQIVVTGLNDAWMPSCYFPVKLGQLLWLDTREHSLLLMKIHKSLGIKTRAMARSLHKPRFLDPAKPCSMSASSLNSHRWWNNNLESRWKFNSRESLEPMFLLAEPRGMQRDLKV